MSEHPLNEKNNTFTWLSPLYNPFKEDILIKFGMCPAFPKQLFIQYENNLCNMMVDLDEPNEIFDQKSNKINIISDDSGDDADRSATPNESEREVSQ